MGSLLWSGNLEASPYSHLLSVDLWARVKEAVAVDGSRVSGLSRESILSVAFRVSLQASEGSGKLADGRIRRRLMSGGPAVPTSGSQMLVRYLRAL